MSTVFADYPPSMLPQLHCKFTVIIEVSFTNFPLKRRKRNLKLTCLECIYPMLPSLVYKISLYEILLNPT